MSLAFQRTLLSLVAAAAIWGYFAHRMLDGVQVVDQAPGRVLWAFAAVVVLFVVAEAAIAGWAAVRQRAEGGIAEDERDVAIAAEAGRWESAVVVSGVNILVLHAILDAAYAGHVLPRVDLTHMPTLVFAMISVLFIGHLTKLTVTALRYRP
jgi:hypothetical protein